MAKPTAKKWYDTLEWSARDPKDTVTIFGLHYPNVAAIHVYKATDLDRVTIRWRNKSSDTLHDFELDPEADSTDQLKALLVSIKMSD